MPNPEASSTPSNLRIRSRKGIHVQNISHTSPIGKATPKDCFGQQQTETRKFENDNMWSQGFSQEGFFYSSDSDSQSSIEQETCLIDSDNNKFTTKYYYLMAVIMAFLMIAILLLPQYKGISNNKYSIEDLENQFNKQDKHFWPSIRVNVQEILEFQQPRVIIFLYENHSLTIVENIVTSISKVAVCLLSDCSQEPINIEGSVLSPIAIQDDFGSIVSNYRQQLDKSGVFIIRNLQLVPGKSAQALHLLCDEYNPLIKRALFLFTVKVDSGLLPHDKYTATQFLETLLLKAWDDIGVDDKFYPLFARISGTILTVR
ncbi:unnamed protein product [Ceutorhynchus assimilis]|uniref:Torsin-1A-interacting protein 1 n=1 Tax=Ceutorhynchus assimilis TaxID=467358 RepID=A0A9P0DUU8_9CUCU|nr:unnamed protein product [Ceutorhynchus assimilis]